MCIHVCVYLYIATATSRLYNIWIPKTMGVFLVFFLESSFGMHWIPPFRVSRLRQPREALPDNDGQ